MAIDLFKTLLWWAAGIPKVELKDDDPNGSELKTETTPEVTEKRPDPYIRPGRRRTWNGWSKDA